MREIFFKVTDNCPHRCDHCYYDAKPTGGRRMNLATFNAASDLARAFEADRIILGGGEPLGHPDLFALLYSLERETFQSDWQPQVVVQTAGAKALPLIRLIELANVRWGGRLQVQVGESPYLPIRQPRASLELQKPPTYPLRQHYSSPAVNVLEPLIKKVVETKLIAQGRAKNLPGAEPGCVQPTPFVSATGDVYSCGCQILWLGNAQLHDLNQIVNNLAPFQDLSCSRRIQWNTPSSSTPETSTEPAAQSTDEPLTWRQSREQ